jgi:hypothetical protein
MKTIRVLYNDGTVGNRRWSNPENAIQFAKELVRSSGVLESGNWIYGFVKVVQGDGFIHNNNPNFGNQSYDRCLWRFDKISDLD